MSKAAVRGVDRLEDLLAEHEALDARLKELARHAYLTPAEEAEISRLKKLKLAKKDRIYDMQLPSRTA